MDLTQSAGITKFLIGSFVHSFFYNWEELNYQVANYNILTGDLWLGGFLNKFEVLFDLVPISLLTSLINGMQFDSPTPFLSCLHWYGALIGEPLFSVALFKFLALRELITHPYIDPHDTPTSFPLPAIIASSKESNNGF
ncbi:hypothetical protein SUGI_0823410 [Cryptomeria japonica]|nr:hypothetical protein SUGI_0823410 [Cryptomeria japonica]